MAKSPILSSPSNPRRGERRVSGGQRGENFIGPFTLKMNHVTARLGTVHEPSRAWGDRLEWVGWGKFQPTMP
jgi:hypothetical protein